MAVHSYCSLKDLLKLMESPDKFHFEEGSSSSCSSSTQHFPSPPPSPALPSAFSSASFSQTQPLQARVENPNETSDPAGNEKSREEEEEEEDEEEKMEDGYEADDEMEAE